jgi:predicted metal-dependent phosphoesterase TrpH
MPANSNGRANLHLHTTFSDGERSPAEVVAAHARAGFPVIALTDHDTLAGLDALAPEAEWMSRQSIRVLPGVELSIEDDPDRGLIEVHLLGYAFDAGSPALRKRLQQASDEREAQKQETVRRLQAAGYPVSWEAVRSRARGNVGKPHIVATIEAARPGQSREALYAAMGPGGIAHVPRARDLSLDEGVALLRGASGVPVLAHPGVYQYVEDLELLFRTCAEAGVLGLEVTYPQDPRDPYGPGSQRKIDRFAAVAQRYGWVQTGGDDFHGPTVTPLIRLAEWTSTPASAADALLELAGR